MNHTVPKPPQQMKLESGTYVPAARAARILQCSLTSIYRYIDRGDLTGKRPGRRGWYRVSYDSIIAFVEKMEKEAAEPGSTDFTR